LSSAILVPPSAHTAFVRAIIYRIRPQINAVAASAREKGRTREDAVIGITFSPERIMAAPAEVRRWLEHEVAAALGLHVPELVEAQRSSPRLVALDVEEAVKVSSLIEGAQPMVNAFFELGREGSSAGLKGAGGVSARRYSAACAANWLADAQRLTFDVEHGLFRY
jgi:hypothetical protein